MMLVAMLIVMFAAAALVLVVLLGRRNVREGNRVGREMVREKEGRAPPEDPDKPKEPAMENPDATAAADRIPPI